MVFDSFANTFTDKFDVTEGSGVCSEESGETVSNVLLARLGLSLNISAEFGLIPFSCHEKQNM